MALTARRSAFDRGRCVCKIEMQFLPGAALWSPHPSHFCRSGGSCRSSIQAIVAELADAHGSGPCTRKGVGVRVPSMAPRFLLIRSPSPRSGFRLRAPSSLTFRLMPAKRFEWTSRECGLSLKALAMHARSLAPPEKRLRSGCRRWHPDRRIQTAPGPQRTHSQALPYNP